MHIASAIGTWIRARVAVPGTMGVVRGNDAKKRRVISR
jgi:hypothetical protein